MLFIIMLLVLGRTLLSVVGAYSLKPQESNAPTYDVKRIDEYKTKRHVMIARSSFSYQREFNTTCSCVILILRDFDFA